MRPHRSPAQIADLAARGRLDPAQVEADAEAVVLPSPAAPKKPLFYDQFRLPGGGFDWDAMRRADLDEDW